MYLKLAVWTGLGLYALLSATDWGMTRALLRMHPGAVEANPVAAACLERHGWDGLALYKAGGVLMFAGAIYLLVSRRPAVAAAVVGGACTVLLAVTLYTHGLIREAHRDAVERAEDAAWPKPKPGTPEATPTTGCWLVPEAPATSPVVRTAARK